MNAPSQEDPRDQSPRTRSVDLYLVVVATPSFGAAMALRNEFNPWVTNTAVALLVLLWCRPHLRDIARGAPGDWLKAALLGVFMSLLCHALFPVLDGPIPMLRASVTQLYGRLQHGPGPVLAPLLTLLIVTAEECVWRGALWNLRSGAPTALQKPAPWIFIAAAAYTVPQIIGGSWILMVAAFSLGLVLCTQRMATGRMGPPWLTHALWSLTIFDFFPLV